MSTNLSGNALTLNNTSLNEETLKAIRSYCYVPDNCKVGDTVILDGIECLCVATGVTIQGSSLTRIAVDKNHYLGYYQKYVGIVHNGIEIAKINLWRWGGYGTSSDTYSGLGYGLQNTNKCLGIAVNYGKGTYTGTTGDGYPWLWKGVNDFRSSHSDKWFVPSLDELCSYIYPNVSSLNDTGSYCWSSTEFGHNTSLSAYYVWIRSGKSQSQGKNETQDVRLCRAF